MPRNSYKTPKNIPATVNEPVAVYQSRDVACSTKMSSSNSWNPNVPFIGTQEEWWEHFHRIEKGEFMTIEEADKEFEIWERELLASRM